MSSGRPPPPPPPPPPPAFPPLPSPPLALASLDHTTIPQMADGALFPVANALAIGAYQQAVNEAQTLMGLSETEATERDALMYRAYIAMGSPKVVLDEVTDGAPMALQAVKLLARYVNSNGAESDAILATITEWLADPACSTNPTVLLMAATIYAREGNYNEALKCSHVGTTLDLMAMSVQMFLQLDRVDFAEKQLRAMSQLDDDATLTQLATAWVNVRLGGNKIQEAYYVYSELGEKFSWTARLYAGCAACQMHMGRFEEAERDLLEALSKDAKDSDALANLIACAMHLGKPTARHVTQLTSVDPNHPALLRMKSLEDSFARASAASVA